MTDEDCYDEDIQNALSLLLFGRPVNSQNIGDLDAAALHRLRKLEEELAQAKLEAQHHLEYARQKTEECEALKKRLANGDT